MALGFLGLVHHLLGDVDSAIIKYHEVRTQVLALTTVRSTTPHLSGI